jgi:ribosomal protein L40E
MSNSTIVSPAHKEIGSLVPNEDGRDLRTEKATQAEKFAVDKDLTKELLALKSKCEDRQKSEWLEIKKQFVRCRQYNDGKQYGDVTDQFNWVDDALHSDEELYIENFFQTHVQTALTELTRVEPQFNFFHVGGESRTATKLTKFFEERSKYYRQRLFTATKKQHEKLSSLLNGVAARYTYFEYEKSQAHEASESKEHEMMEDKPQNMGMEVCATCYAPKTAEKCSRCGDTDSKMLEDGDSYESKGMGIGQESPRGTNKWVNVDPIGLTFDLKAQTVTDTAYIIWKQIIMDEILENKYPDIALQDGVTAPELLYDTATDTPGEGYGNASSSTQTGTKQFEQCWFDYEMYCHKRLKVDIKLRNGRILKAGTTLGQNFPNGLYMAVNGNRILDLWGENKNRKWTIAPYVTRIGTLVGAGLTILLSQQDRKNDIVSLKMVSIFKDAYRQEFLNSKYITNDDMPDDPRMRAELENIPPGMRIVGEAIDVLPPSTLSPLVSETEQQIEAAAQAQVGTFSSGGAGMPDLKAATDTLGGMQLYREQTVGRFSPMLEIQADLLDKEQLYQLFENDKEYLSPQDWQELAGDYGKESIELFLNCDIRREIIIEVVKESYMPKTVSQKQMQMNGYVQVMSGMMQIGMTSPEQTAHVATLFDQPQRNNNFLPAYDKARASTNAFSEIVDEIIQATGDLPRFDVADPTTIQLARLVVEESGMDIDPEMDDHLAMIESYKDWWNTDAGREAPNLLKAVVALRVKEHQALMVQKAQLEAAMAMEAQQPMIDAQMAQEQAAQVAGQDQASADAERQEQGAMMQGLGEMSENDAQREHEQVIKDAELKDAEAQRMHDAAENEKQRMSDEKSAKTK